MSKCIGATLKQRIFDDLKASTFSILIDGSSDLYGGKYLAVLVRYLGVSDELPITKLVSILEIQSESTGEALYQKVAEEFKDKDIKQNIVAICTDNEQTMISSKGSVVNPKGKGLANRLVNDLTHVIHIRDRCHLYNLICEDALKTFPVYILHFVKKVCAHFSSAQRSNSLREIQIAAGEKTPLSILRYVDIRWESLVQCSERILKLWEHLINFFKGTDASLKEEIQDPEYKLYTYLLYILLHKLSGYTVFFQRPALLWDQVFEKMKESYIVFARMLLKESFRGLEYNEISEIPFENLEDAACKEKLSCESEFSKFIAERYPKILQLIEETKALHPTRKEIDRHCFSHAKAFILQVVV